MEALPLASSRRGIDRIDDGASRRVVIELIKAESKRGNESLGKPS